MAQEQFIQIIKNGPVGELIINNPQKANCLNRQLWFQIPLAVEELNEDAQIKACILSSRGKHFSSGIDLNFLKSIMSDLESFSETERPLQLKKIIKEMQEAFSSIEQSPRPWIAAIHGLCLGGAIDLIAACDIRLGTWLSTYSILETRLGIVADMGTLQRLNRVIPEGALKQLALTSEFFMGLKAWRLGLLNKIYPTQNMMMKAARKLAWQLAELPAYSISGTKKTLNFSRDHTIQDGLDQIAELNSKLLLSSEAREHFKQQMGKLE